MIQECEQLIEVTIGIEQPTGFLMELQLCPGECLYDFFQCSGAAGHRNKAVGKHSHHGFPVVHGVDDMQPGQTVREPLPCLSGIEG